MSEDTVQVKMKAPSGGYSFMYFGHADTGYSQPLTNRRARELAQQWIAAHCLSGWRVVSATRTF